MYIDRGGKNLKRSMFRTLCKSDFDLSIAPSISGDFYSLGVRIRLAAFFYPTRFNFLIFLSSNRAMGQPISCDNFIVRY